MKRCIFCGKELPNEAIFCHHCGKDQTASKVTFDQNISKCPFCGKDNTFEATFCIQCGKKIIKNNINIDKATSKKTEVSNNKKNIKRTLIVAGVILIVIAIFKINEHQNKIDDKEYEAKTSKVEKKGFLNKSDAELQSLIDELKTTGLLKKIDENYYYVDPTIWNYSNIDIKKGISMTFADYSLSKGKMNFCYIYDYMSGKKIAKLDSWGFKTFE